nr:hypothetical protein [Tanacetum cinerariifolium]
SLEESILAIGEDFASSDAILSLKSCCKLVGLANLASQVGWRSRQEGFLGKLLLGDREVQVCNLGEKNGYRVQCFKRRGDKGECLRFWKLWSLWLAKTNNVSPWWVISL